MVQIGAAQQLVPEETPLVILAEGHLATPTGKTATGVLRYGRWPIEAVIDSTQAGKTVEEVTGIPHSAPVVSSLAEAMASAKQPIKGLMIGVAPQGGGLPAPWRALLLDALSHKLHLISGLHMFLADDAELLQAATANEVLIWDVRNPVHYRQDHHTVADDMVKMRSRPADTQVVTMVGTDCAVGKMVTALELVKVLRAAGESAIFVATGQTGILIEGSGVPLDRLIGDFMAGHLERTIDEAIAKELTPPRWVVVEGQGALSHPSYAGVTLSLLHGSRPDAMVLCTRAGQTTIRGEAYGQLRIAPLDDVVHQYEDAAMWARAYNAPWVPVVGVAANTSGLSVAEASEWMSNQGAVTQLPVVDPIRTGVGPLVEALIGWRQA